jgi:hypothetical protein
MLSQRNMLDAVAKNVADELAGKGFMPNPLRAKLVGSRMALRGEQEFKSLAEAGGPSLDCFRALCTRCLGVGASLTAFLISGLPLDKRVRAEIETLGGIANTIVAVFDSLLDVSQSAPVLFAADPQFSDDASICASQKLVCNLVDLYFRKLDLLSTTAPRVRLLLERAIQRLYEAELRTAEPNRMQWSAWWRKNALLMIIMGLPAWLQMRDSDESEFAAHVMWLGRVGEFFGWLDDASDYELDQMTGGANWLRQRHESSIKECARRIAAKGQRVLSFWDARNSDSRARDTFTVIAWMWLNPACPDMA